jgi:hypothetical protein
MGKEDVDLEQQRGQQQGMPFLLVLFFFNSWICEWNSCKCTQTLPNLTLCPLLCKP